MHDHDYDEARRVRDADRGAIDDASRAQGDPMGGATRLLCQTVQVASYPTAAGKFFGVRRVAITGEELEGKAATLTLVGAAFYALHVGSTLPPQGTYVEVVKVPNRFVFVYNG